MTRGDSLLVYTLQKTIGSEIIKIRSSEVVRPSDTLYTLKIYNLNLPA